MSLRFQRRVSIFPMVRLNFSVSGVSVTVGVPGASVTLGGHGGSTANLGIPGSGLSMRIPLQDSQVEGKTDPSEKSPLRGFWDQPGGLPTQMRPVQSGALDELTTQSLSRLRNLMIGV